MPEVVIDARPFLISPLHVAVPTNDATVGSLAAEIAKSIPTIDLETVKLLAKGGHVVRLTSPEQPLPVPATGSTLRFKLLASSKADVNQIKHAKEAPAMPSFEHEEQRERLRQTPISSSTATGPPTFARYQAWEPQGLSLTPPPSEAAKLLKRIASDAGILGCMKKRGWRVGLLSEMPPEGKVGISAVCVLGYNRNAGQEISLRLRTDDLQGFRRYDKIRETLIHELAHNVFSDHDDNFKNFNSELRREVAALDWQAAPGARSLAGFSGTTASSFGAGAAPTLGLGAHPSTSQAATTTRGPQKLGGGAGGAASSDPRAAAAAAAERRIRASELSSYPVQITPPPSPPASPPKKGEIVEYRQRDGSYVDARIVAVDLSVIPPSYGIELLGIKDSYRETEGNRLRKKRVDGGAGEEAEAGGVEKIAGLGHRDASTEAKEQEVEWLEQA